MKCKKCGFDWQPHGEQLICPNCGESAAMTHTEQQALWNEANNAQKIKDYTLRANCYLRLAEQGDRKAEYQGNTTYTGSSVQNINSLLTTSCEDVNTVYPCLDK